MVGMRKALRRWYWWLPALLVLTPAGYVCYRVMHPPSADCRGWAEYREIRPGMARAQVEAILGTAPDIGGGILVDPRFGPLFDRTLASSSGAIWHGQEFWIAVVYDAHESVLRKQAVIGGREFSDPPVGTETWWDRWRARIGW
jgi:hypothetical protein